MNCSEGYTDQSEFTTLSSCSISNSWYTGLRSVAIAVPVLISIIEAIMFIIRYEEIKKKEIPTQVLLWWALFQNIFMGARPILNLVLDLTSQQSIAVALVTHLSCAAAAGIVILFIYIQMNFLVSASLNKWNCFDSRKGVLITIAVIESVLFFVGPFLYPVLNAHIAFWAPVIVVDFTVIPYFTAMGFMVRRKISKMLDPKSVKLARRILIVALICTAIGMFTGAVGLYAVFGTPYEWVLVELCWISDNVFNLIIFTVFARKKRTKTKTISQGVSMTPTQSND